VKRIAMIVVASVFLLASTVALAAPGDSETPPSTGAGDAKPPANDKPSADDKPPPGATSPGKDGGHLPGAGDPFKPGPKKWPTVMYGLGVSAMMNIVPQFMFRAFTEAAVHKKYNFYDWAAGIHFVRRKKLLDMTVRVMFGHYGVSDGNWLGANHDWNEVDYTEFHNLNFLWADITWTWHTRLAKRFYLAYGVGIGIGWVMGKVYTTPSNGCSASNYSDTSPGQCSPGPPAVCDGTSCTRESLADHPDREEETVPPVLPAISGLIGLRYDLFRHLSVKFDTGLFLPGFFYFQLSLTAFF
jgi:hypothetical protein